MRSKVFMQSSLLVVVVLLLFLTTSCGGEKNVEEQSANSSTSYSVTDITGRTIHFDTPPQRIVTLSATLDQIVLSVVPPERLVAVHSSMKESVNSNMVELASQIPETIHQPSVEYIVSLHPDVVLVADWQYMELADPLRDAGLKVVIGRGPHNLAEVKDLVRLATETIGEKRRGEILLKKMDEKLAEIKAKVDAIPQEKRKSVVFLSLMPTYGGKGSSFDDACHYAGVINGVSAYGLRNGQEVTKEVILSIDPDVLFLPDYPWKGQEWLDAYIRSYTEDPALQTLKALKNHSLVSPRSSFLYNCSQDFVYGVQEIAYRVYGDEFYLPADAHISAVDE
ncbi:ABC transporter substrate-binding protein [Selenomonas sputigena]|uniref:Periplasmic binding protein n=2 Tax=Selenomonas sputigena (strain ATCC 35185 / DSM 20758 / CCUG 44933 / VPI D19B-28) TaxID=546271 RepID=C9LTL2_SELS3|nr:ABC transporter substrate-binding protein [Selenomonas sputigena]EEX77746.1 periplasmic binding protein [Selenomonas sputigena ATCC 35185]